MTVPTQQDTMVEDVVLEVAGKADLEHKEPEQEQEQADTCLLCYESFETGAVERQVCGAECDLVACRDCLARGVQVLVDASYDGVVPTVRCHCSQRRILPRSAWGAWVPEEAQATFVARAKSTASLQCAGCHKRGTLLKTVEEGVEDAEAGLLLRRDAPELDALVAAFEAGEAPPAAVVEAVYGSYADAQTAMAAVLGSVQDDERRARLLVARLSRDPFVKTLCHQKLHCFRCKTKNEHPGQTCEEVQASRANDLILNCPGCNMALVRGDGCSSVTCVCGQSISWTRLVQKRHTELAAELVAWFEEEVRVNAYRLAEREQFRGDPDQHLIEAEAAVGGPVEHVAVAALRDEAHPKHLEAGSFVTTHRAANEQLRAELARSWEEAHADEGLALSVRAAVYASSRTSTSTASWRAFASRVFTAQHAELLERIAAMAMLVGQAGVQHQVRHTRGPAAAVAARLMLHPETTTNMRSAALALAQAEVQAAPEAEAAVREAFEARFAGEDVLAKALQLTYPTCTEFAANRAAPDAAASAFAAKRYLAGFAQAADDFLVEKWRRYFDSHEAALEAARLGRRPVVQPELRMRAAGIRAAQQAYVARFPEEEQEEAAAEAEAAQAVEIVC